MNPSDDRALGLLSDSTNRRVVAILADADGGLDVPTLAHSLVSTGSMAYPPSEYEERIERTSADLHHVRLPRLEDAGLLAYAQETAVVRSVDDPAVNAESLQGRGIDDVLSVLAASKAFEDSPVDVLERSAAIDERCLDLADAADTELFLIYASTALLDEGWLARVGAAVDRGVDVRAGAKTEGTRRCFRTHLPAATVWEPQLDWMNQESGSSHVSRLVVADRETVLVGIRDEVSDDDTTETAVIGDGPHNSLVALVRELLGPRLDHLDFQSEDFFDDLPFER